MLRQATCRPASLLPDLAPLLRRHQGHVSWAEPADIRRRIRPEEVHIRLRTLAEDILHTEGHRSPVVDRNPVAGRRVADHTRPADHKAIAEAGYVFHLRLALTTIRQTHLSWFLWVEVAADRSSAAALVHKTHPARHLDSSYRSPHAHVRS